MFIPGFRSHKKVKMSVSTLYYIFSLLMATQGIGYFLFIASLPFIIFSAIDFIKTKNSQSKVILFISSLILIFSIAIVPKANADYNIALKNSPSPQGNITQSATPYSKEFPTQTTTETPEPIINPKPDNTSNVSGTLEVHFLDVGQADSILITQGNSAMLIDGGNNADADVVTKYLKNQGVTKLDYVIGTHPHEDHIGGLDAVIKSFDIGSVIMPKAQSNTKTFEDLLRAIQEKNLKITTPVPGNEYNFGDAKFVIVAPNSITYDETNDYSVVIKLTYGNNSFLLTGDAEAISENEILSKGYNIKADVLKVGHHGSTSSTTKLFLRDVSPKYAIISVGQDNSYGHPKQEILNLLKNESVTTYRTDELGTIIALTDGKTISFKFQKNSSNEPTPKPTPSPSQTQKPIIVPVPTAINSGGVVIDKVDLSGELVTIRNTSSSDVNLTGWKLLSVKGEQTYFFPDGCIIKGGSSLTIATGNAVGDLKWNNKNIWNNDGDPAELYNSAGKQVSRK